MRDTLTCNGYQLDLSENIAFPLTFSVADYKNPDKRKRTFSTPVTLEGTARNRAFFAEAYGYHSAGGNVSFDATKRTKAVYEKQGLPIINDGVLQLIEVVIKDGIPKFKVQVYSEGVDIFLLLSNLRLVDLFWGDLNHILNRTNIKNSWSTPDGEGYRYPLIIYRTQLAPLVWRTTDLVPYVHFVDVIRRIFDRVGVTYQSNFFDDDRIKKILYGFGGGDYINKTLTTQERDLRMVTLGGLDVIELNVTRGWVGLGDFTNQLTTLNGIRYNIRALNPVFNDIVDESVQYSEGAIYVNKSGNYHLTLEFDISYTTNLISSPQYSGYMGLKNTSLIVTRNGVDISTYVDSNIVSVNNYNISNPSTYPTYDGTLYLELDTYLDSGDVIEFDLITPEIIVSSVNWSNVSTLNTEFSISFSSIDMTSIDTGISDGSVVAITRFLPDVKCSEFLLSAFRQFNLMMSEPDEITGIVTIEPEIDFYGSPNDAWDITDIIDYSKPFEIEPTANTVSKNTLFEFKKLDDYDAEFYRNKWEREYGDCELINPSFYAKGETKQSLAWGTIVPYQINTASTGNIVCPRYITFDDNGNAKPNKGVGRLVFWNGLKNGQWSLRNNENATGELLTTYPCIHHFDDFQNPEMDLNFSLVDQFRYQSDVLTTANCFNMFYRNFYSNIISMHSKTIKCHIKIDNFDMKQRNMRRLVMINESLFKINSIGAFDVNVSSTTAIELVRVITPRNFNMSSSPNVGYNGWGIDVILGVQNEVGVGAGFIGNIKDDVGKYAKFLKSN